MIVEVLYNPTAGQDAQAKLEKLKTMFAHAQLRMRDITKGVAQDVLHSLKEEDCVVVAGGDGTLNRFLNALDPERLKCGIRYYPIGSGNDFAHDLGNQPGCEPFDIRHLIRNLPILKVNGRVMRFLNGAGAGLDGYVCKAGNDRHKRTGKPVNYTLVAIMSLLFGYKPVDADVTVDGVTKHYKKVWLASAMFGRFFGGGMMIAPMQDRANAQRHVTGMVYSGRGKLFTMCVFPSIFKGEHVKYDKDIIFTEGSRISVRFSTPCILQVDGEIIENVSEYTVEAGV